LWDYENALEREAPSEEEQRKNREEAKREREKFITALRKLAKQEEFACFLEWVFFQGKLNMNTFTASQQGTIWQGEQVLARKIWNELALVEPGLAKDLMPVEAVMMSLRQWQAKAADMRI
jgi:hypothetical protein